MGRFFGLGMVLSLVLSCVAVSETLNVDEPVWVSGFPRVQDVGSSEVKIMVNLTLGGIVYAACWPAGSQAPSSAAIVQAGQASLKLIAKAESELVIGNLQDGTYGFAL